MYDESDLRLGLGVWLIILTFCDIAGTYYLLKKYETKEGTKRALEGEQNKIARYMFEKLGMFKGAIGLSILATTGNTLVSFYSPLWLLGFAVGYYFSTVSYHYYEYKALKQNGNMG
jgi:uncharacterized membrane protein